MTKKKNTADEFLFEKCPQCHFSVYIKELEESLWVCPKCSYYFRLPYSERIKSYRDKTKINEALVSGTAKMEGINIVIAVLDFSFMGGSMGSVVGEKVCRAAELAIRKKYPVIIFSSSG